MITFKNFQGMHNGKTSGRARKSWSDSIMLNTWDQDIQAQTCYIYDYYHDQKSDEALKLNNLNPEKDEQKTPLKIKFIRHSKQTYDKDQITFWLQLQPGQECNLDYYEEVLGKRYDALFPIGLYVDIMHEDGTYNKWLIVDKANYNGNQFPTFEILKCDKVFQWIFKGRKYQCAGVLRSQNSYNSGLWLDFKIQSVEDQQKFAVPMARETETLFYNIRMIIDAKVESEPRAWLISKINRISPNGICRVTLTQDIFDQHKDFVEKDENGNIVGQWGNYYSSTVEPIPVEVDEPMIPITSKITCSGKPIIKIGGSAKTFTITYYDENGEVMANHDSGVWALWIGDQRVPNSLVQFYEIDDPKKLKFKFLGDDSFIGKILIVKNTYEDLSTSLDVEITAL